MLVGTSPSVDFIDEARVLARTKSPPMSSSSIAPSMPRVRVPDWRYASISRVPPGRMSAARVRAHARTWLGGSTCRHPRSTTTSNRDARRVLQMSSSSQMMESPRPPRVRVDAASTAERDMSVHRSAGRTAAARASSRRIRSAQAIIEILYRSVVCGGPVGRMRPLGPGPVSR